MANKKKTCKRNCNDCEATIRQMFTLSEMVMVKEMLESQWCPSKHWTNMKSVLSKLEAVIGEVQSEQPV